MHNTARQISLRIMKRLIKLTKVMNNINIKHSLYIRKLVRGRVSVQKK